MRKNAIKHAQNVRIHAQSISHAFALCLYIQYYPMVLLADSEGPDQTARMRSLIWAFAVRISPKTRFRMVKRDLRYITACK